MIIKLRIDGRPATKKNSGRYIPKIHKLLPSEAYSNYEKSACWQLKMQYHGEPIKDPMEITVKYIMDSRRAWPDLVGLMQATSDILQKAEIIEDDRYIVRWGETEISDVDPKHPGALITIETFPLDGENDVWYELDPKLFKRLEEWRNVRN
ncbi:RusA family crossover junction endodeoxyribonuclease [Acidaminococcus massiliensis]|jgi:Holliday junction resolvase RusA-like endonuclease|uniref:RusA family crossover junction endodeoxyribonuclease n=1 Tax=Acidaminococcus massiliensis TaxID=1852375 RepID=UPI0020692D56|nr:RusA family crossover junction endodeoxyribonuclease [Acidaminococcus massiliensis]DAR24864.1 MAG TPA: Endodeoxyribonuclease RusA [Caudoviricetes sp.]